MFTYGIGETAKRLRAFMSSDKTIASVYATLALVIAILLARVVSTYEMNGAQVFALIAFAFIALALLGGSLLTEHNYGTARKRHNQTLKKYIAHYSAELEREILARTELQKLVLINESIAKTDREYLEEKIRAYKTDLANCRQNLRVCALFRLYPLRLAPRARLVRARLVPVPVPRLVPVPVLVLVPVA